jgi:hypothetical protein
MEKTISVRRTTITFSIWDLGGLFFIPSYVDWAPLIHLQVNENS